MRLTLREIDIIKKTVHEFLPGVEVYLFGSRVDDTKRGGDIDILIVGDTDEEFWTVVHIKSRLKERLGDQKIDIVYERREAMTPFGELAKMDGALL
ncbi:MAG: nucleotidyltransferase domain-containing protein [Ignavibacteriae bacterium]|nr:nucleotidyltransferase domain-containing protein [Ignavibacteriota bacterium]